MMQFYRVTYAVLVLMIIGGITTLTGKEQNPFASESREKLTQREQEFRNFPTAEYDEQEPSDPQKQAALRRKKARHNKGGLVFRNPDPDTGGGAWLPEGQFDFPALPTDLSDVVVLGEVMDAQAHVSEDKSNVYSEFRIRIGTVFKSRESLGAQLTVERLGGWVRYPNGRKLIYLLGGAQMPRVGGKYLLFLKYIGQTEDLSIVTGYEFGPAGVSALDHSPQFEAYRGHSEDSFLTELRTALAKPATRQE